MSAPLQDFPVFPPSAISNLRLKQSTLFGSGELPGKMLLVRIIENIK